MPKVLILLLFALGLLAPCAAAERRDEDAVLQSFQPVVDKFTAFFQKNPKLLTKVAPSQNPGLRAFSITHFLRVTCRNLQ